MPVCLSRCQRPTSVRAGPSRCHTSSTARGRRTQPKSREFTGRESGLSSKSLLAVSRLSRRPSRFSWFLFLVLSLVRAGCRSDQRFLKSSSELDGGDAASVLERSRDTGPSVGPRIPTLWNACPAPSLPPGAPPSSARTDFPVLLDRSADGVLEHDRLLIQHYRVVKSTGRTCRWSSFRPDASRPPLVRRVTWKISTDDGPRQVRLAWREVVTARGHQSPPPVVLGSIGWRRIARSPESPSAWGPEGSRA